jgi:hypothetical protein
VCPEVSYLEISLYTQLLITDQKVNAVCFSTGEFPYAKCFICGEIGHLTRSCPDNPRGLYPRGGGCKICGSVEHLKANCPDGNKSTKVTTSAATSERGGGVSAVSLSADALDNEVSPPVRKRQKTGGRRAKIVKF